MGVLVVRGWGSEETGRRGEDEGKGWWRGVWVVARCLHQQAIAVGISLADYRKPMR